MLVQKTGNPAGCRPYIYLHLFILPGQPGVKAQLAGGHGNTLLELAKMRQLGKEKWQLQHPLYPGVGFPCSIPAAPFHLSWITIKAYFTQVPAGCIFLAAVYPQGDFVRPGVVRP